jgi:hypothetical protein
VNIPIHYGREHFNNDMDLVTYMADKKSTLSIAVATSKSSKSSEEDIRTFFNALKEANIITNIRIFYYDTVNVSEIHETDPANIFEPAPDKMLRVTVNEDYSIESLSIE